MTPLPRPQRPNSKTPTQTSRRQPFSCVLVLCERERMRTRPRRRLFWLRCCPCHHAACPSALPPSPCPQRRERDAVSPNPVHTPGCANPSTLSSAVTCDYSIGTPLLLHRAPSHLYFCITATQATCHTETPQLLYRCGPIHTETPRVFYSDHADVVRHTQTSVTVQSHTAITQMCSHTG